MKSNGSKQRKLLISIGFVFVLACGALLGYGQDAPGIQWQNDINQAVNLARSSNRLILVHFYGANCPPCKAMDATVFPDPRVVDEMNRHFVAVKADMALNAALAKKMEISVIPTDIVLDANGQVLHRRQGGISADRFLQYLAYLQGVAQNSSKPVSQTAAPVQTSAAPAALIAPTQVPVQTSAVPAVPVAPDAAGQVLHDPFTKQPVLPATPAAPVPAATSAPATPAAPAFAAIPVPAASTTPVASTPVTVAPAMPVASTPAPVAPAMPVASTPVPVAPAAAPVATVPIAEKTVAERSNPVRPMGEKTAPPVSEIRSDEKCVAATVEIPLALEGYCPVVLGNEERWVPGNPAFYAMYRGQVYRFSSEAAMTTFLTSPVKFAPIALGEDVVLMVDRNKKAYGCRKFGAWYEGRVYLFSCQETLDAFAARPDHYAEIALKYETAFKSPHDTVQR